MTDDQTESNFLDNELENRLDELFGDDETRMADTPAVEPSDDRLKELKSSVLSIDWEISDEGLQHFASQIDATRSSFSDDKIVLMFLQILGALGDYIRSNRGKAHPKTFKILTAVFSALETVVCSPDMSEMEKKKALQIELKRYNELRGLIQKKKANADDQNAKSKGAAGQADQARRAPPGPSGGNDAAAPGEPLTVRTLMTAVEELKAFVHDEIEALRKEMVRPR